jgi:hypothetical protein
MKGFCSYVQRSVLVAIVAMAAFAGSAEAAKAPPPTPENLVQPTLSGTPEVGQTLSMSTGTWQGAATYYYDWEKCDPANQVPAAGFESHMDGWSPLGTTLTRTTERAYEGASSMKATLPGAWFSEGVAYTFTAGPSLRYKIAFQLYSSLSGPEMSLSFDYLDAAGVKLQQSTATASPPPLRVRWNMWNETITTPPGTAKIRIVLTSPTRQAVQLWLDDVHVHSCVDLNGTVITNNPSHTVTEDEIGSLLVGVTWAANSSGYLYGIWKYAGPVADIGDEVGIPESDNAEIAADLTESTPAAAEPISPIGPAPPGTYTTELWSGASTGTEDGLLVVSSTAPGTSAVTGVARDMTTGDPVSGASVTLTGGTTQLATTSNAAGAYAFIDIPSGSYELSIAAPNYGAYRLLNNTMGADATYQVTADLDTTAQTFDESDVATVQGPPTNPGTAYSQTRVPPTIRVGVFPLHPPGAVDSEGHSLNCSRSADSYTVVTYPFDYYILRVAKQEVSIVQYNKPGEQAFFALAQNYGWFHKTLPGPFDIENSTRHQCFRPERMVDRRWNSWLQDNLDERVIRSDGKLLETLYLAGSQPIRCPDPTVGAGIASQWTIKGLSEGTGAGCTQRTDWRNIVTYFYGGSRVVPGALPPQPVANATVSGGAITFTFSSRQLGANVAWKFSIEMRRSDGTWARVGLQKWKSSLRAIPSSFRYVPAASTCRRYRVRASNPVGWSTPGQVTAPGTGLSPTGTCTL